MENETLETFLTDLGYQKHLDLFNKNNIDLGLLKSLPETTLKETLQELGLKVGVRIKIQQKLENMKTKGT